jgi:DNA-binding NarL/FixJ family response regulator
MTVQDLKPIRVLLVDDHAVVRAGLRMLLESRPGLTVVGEAADRATALTMASKEQPDIILLDLDLGGDSSVDFLPDLQAASDRARVIVLTGLRDPAVHRRSIQLGAVGVIYKENAVEVLMKAIEKVLAGELWLERSLMASLITEMRAKTAPQPPDPEAAKVALLTDREREVIALIAEGLRNKQVADRLSVSEITVRHHLTSIFRKLGLSDRLELALYAHRQNLAKSPPPRDPPP